jgi:hypothetical protein
VFSDATLQAIADTRPGSRAEMAGIPGVGAVKLDRYGAAVLELCADVVRSTPESAVRSTPESAVRSTPADPATGGPDGKAGHVRDQRGDEPAAS